MKRPEYAPNKEDVAVLALEPDECETCGDLATHGVQMELRAVGQSTCIGVFCELHAADMAERLRDSLPEVTP